jgi:LmbE family N-acetylglucosaminyl deacetylase
MSPETDMPYDRVYLSPHLDDAVLSCGGSIWQGARSGERVLVVTVFAGVPPADALLSPFVQELHTRWGHLDDTVAQRREEDQAALALLGAEAVHWPYTDCIYRQTPDGRFPYASEEALWGEVHVAEMGLISELADRMAALPLSSHYVDTLTRAVCAPLGVGHHVDHQIVRQAVESSGHASLYYEDYPYAKDRQAVLAALQPEVVGWQADLVSLSQDALRAKIAAIACYRSQLSTFWTGLTEMSAEIRAFAELIGSGGPAERYWVLDT